MEKLFRTSAWLFAILLAVGMIGIIGCGGDDDDDDDDTVAATLNSTDPADGGTVSAGGMLTMTFSADPGAVTVNGQAADGTGTKRTYTIPVADAGQSKTYAISWADGDESVTLTVGEVDTTPPSLVGSSPVEDGDEDVEYDGLTEIKLTFSEAMNTTASRVIEIMPAGGSSLKWTVTWEEGDTVAVLTAGKGSSLSAETEYEVKATAPTDKAGNKIDDVVITFTTRAKE